MNQPPFHLEARDLAVRRGGRLVLSGVHFRAAKGEALWIGGPNGAGKSTLLRTLAGLLAPEQGEILWTGTRVAEDMTAHHARLHYAGHKHGLKPVLTVRENIEIHTRLMGGSKNNISDALEKVGLDRIAGLPVRYLSEGQQRRLALARILAAPRPVWLLDEPTAGLDSASAGAVRGLVENHIFSGGIAIFTSHADLGVAKARRLDLMPGADGAARLREPECA